MGSSNNTCINSTNVLLSNFVGIYVNQAMNTSITCVTANHSWNGVLVKNSLNTCIEKTITLNNEWDITVLNSQSSTIVSTTVVSNATTRSLTLQNAVDSYISDINFIEDKKNVNKPVTKQAFRVDYVVFLQYFESTILRLNISHLSRGITVFKCIDTKFVESSFLDVSYPAVTTGADPTTLPAIIAVYFSNVELNQCNFSRNSLSCMKALNSTVTLRGIVSFTDNTAIAGTAFLLVKDSRIAITDNTHGVFDSNQAADTGGVFYELSTNMHYDAYTIYDSVNYIITSTVCFLDVPEENMFEKHFPLQTIPLAKQVTYSMADKSC